MVSWVTISISVSVTIRLSVCLSLLTHSRYVGALCENTDSVHCCLTDDSRYCFGLKCLKNTNCPVHRGELFPLAQAIELFRRMEKLFGDIRSIAVSFVTCCCG